MQPYTPQTPASPETFAGRHEMLDYVREATETARQHRRGRSILLHGYRGSGKTSALRKIEAMVVEVESTSVVVEVPLRVPSSEALLLHAIAEQVRRSIARHAGTSARVRQALQSLSSITVLGSGVQRVPPTPEAALHPLTIWADVLEALDGVPVFCLCIDDAELLETEQVGILKTIAESASPTPIVMIVAGGPELIEKLSMRGGSPVLRAFSGAIFDLGQFTLEETREALEAPLRHLKSPAHWEEQAVTAIHHLTHGYPYLVQCFAAATYLGGRRITASDVQSKVPQALRLAASWLERELPRASDEDIRTFVKIANLGQSEMSSEDLRPLEIVPAYLSRLERAGVLKRLARGHYELRMAPAVAYFHALRRGLDTR